MKTWVPCVLILLGLLIYGGSFSGTFLGDDEVIIVNNPLIQGARPVSEIFTSSYTGDGVYYRPLAVFTHFLEYPFFGLRPAGYHVINTLLHSLNAILVFLILLKFFPHRMFAVVTALLFLVHPIHTEEVTYISGRCGLLVATFLLLSLIYFIHAIKNKQKVWLAGSWAFFCLALFSKEAAIVFPLLLVFLDRAIMKNPLRETLRRAIPFFALTLVFILWRNWLDIGFVRPETILPGLFSRILVMCQVLGMYMGLLAFPVELVSDRLTALPNTLEWRQAIPFLMVLIILAGLAWSARRSVITRFALGWFFILMIPMLHIVPLTVQGYLFTPEHFMYLPSVAVFMLFSAFLVRGGVRRIQIQTLTWVMIGVITIGFSVRTVQRNMDYSDPVTFYSLAVHQTPHNARAHTYLGLALNSQGKYPEAEGHFRQAIAYKPNYALAHNNLGISLTGRGDFHSALESFITARVLDPDAKQPQENIAHLRFLMKQKHEAHP